MGAQGAGGGGYTSAYPEYLPDARQRGRVSIAHVLPPGKDALARHRGVPADLVFSSILSKSLLALSLHLVKEWLFTDPAVRADLGAIHFKLLALAALASALWNRPWEAFASGHRLRLPQLGLYAFMLCAESLVFLKAVETLPIIRLIMLTQSSDLWMHGLQTMQKKGIGSTARNANFVAAGTLGLCYIAELYLNRYLPKSSITSGYTLVAGYLLLSSSRLDLLPSISPSTATDSHSASRIDSLGLAASVPIALVFSLFQPFSTSGAAASSTAAAGTSVVLPTLALLALALFLLDPVLAGSMKTRAPVIKGFKVLWPVAVLTSAFIGITAFERTLHVHDFVVGAIAYSGISQILHSDPRLVAEAAGLNPTSVSYTSTKGSAGKGAATALESLDKQWRQIRSTVKTILDNPDSKKIYFFLCLNLAFMFVQMMYGIWTNSLGLISDSIHMFFDCLALGMGLLASVMATWPRNETFTYGYGRVETLSGFANGIFLILISIFIVFEAIQRLIDPPEMNTNQLLVISMAGLAVNLVGMFATGHHHHGHSHGGHDHDHDHGHGHSHNMHGVFLHVMADTLGSVGVIISTLLINRYGWTGFDPIASIFIAVLIFASVVPLVMDSASLLTLDLGSDRERDVRSALSKLSSVEGLSSYAAARFWPKDPSTVVGSIHIQLAPSPSHDPRSQQHQHSHQNGNQLIHYANAEKVVKRVETVLKGAIHGLIDLTIQVEPSEGSELCNCMVGI